ncbi:spermidine/putrescine-binding protein [Acholeplasma morum]|uniref:ABC transporter substrate-binding protein n=1 Tax=Paracholeplasma morum TaxID=264637 RepID=UPI00195959DC|nr:ABC transporter substrate-binding protein [Paracholeplasma morum]MBM7454093.1 spermidine/putrescine-binding protein [Paracholeplasma morum]
MVNIKKLYLMAIVVLGLVILSGCNNKKTLLLLNWGEYLNEEVLIAFEKETGYTVVQDLADSNELFYSKIKSGTTAYDLVIPSDYMIHKMYEKDLLQEIDFTKLTNYDPVNNPFMEGVKGIQSEMFLNNERYAVPYFWGTFGIIYNKQKAGLEEAVLTHGWDAYFDKQFRPAGTRVAMYNVPRFAYSAAMFYNNLDPNVITEETIDIAYDTLLNAGFTEWGFDTLKKGIVANNLDMAFTYTGDFLDMLYTRLDAGDTLEDITFDIYIPQNTIAFMDALVIPKKARHVDAAHEFIDFLLRPEIAYLNASAIGYATPLQKSYDLIVSHLGDEDTWLNQWAYANQTYYPLPLETDVVKYKGTPLANIDQDWIDKITTMVNNVKSR